MRMNKVFVRFIILVLVLIIGVFYGMDLAQKGIEQVYGPLASADQAADEQQGTTDGQASDAQQAQPEVIDYREQQAPSDQSKRRSDYNAGSSTLGYVFRAAGSMIHAVADSMLRLLVKIGETVLD